MTAAEFMAWTAALSSGTHPDTATGKELDELMGLTDMHFQTPCALCSKPFGQHQINSNHCPDSVGGFSKLNTFRRVGDPVPGSAPPPRIDPDKVIESARLYDAQGRGAHWSVLLAVCDATNRELEAAHKIIEEQGKKIELLLREIGTVGRALAEVLPKKPAPTRPAVAKCYCGTTVVFQEFADAQLCSGCGKVHSR